MNAKTWIPLVLAIVLGLVAMKIAKDVLAKRSTPGEARTNLSEVIVVARNLPPGTALKPTDLKVGKMGGDIAPASTFRTIAELDGRVIVAPMFTGQPVMESLLAPKGTGSGLQAVVPKGMRAITLEINEFSGVAGFLVPGCRVDVVSTINADAGEMLSRTIVQNVEVTAIGRRQQPAGPDEAEVEQTRSVTLLVKPKEAEAIELAGSTGRPRLVLRSSGDKELARSEGITVAELRGRKRVDPFAPSWVGMFKPTDPATPATQPSDHDPMVPVAYQPQVQHRTVKVIRAGVESQVTIELPPVDIGPQHGPQKRMTDAKQ